MAGLWLALLLPLSCRSAVQLNEFVAAGSDRIVHAGPGGLLQVGLTTPWHAAGFDDSAWAEAPAPFGFGTFSGITIATDTSLEMEGRTPSLYLRRAFDANSAQAGESSSLRLTVRCNDGFVAYLNGVEIARRNLGPAGSFVFHDQAAMNPETTEASIAIDLGAARNLLHEGRNVLSLQVHNVMNAPAAAGSFLVSASLSLQAASPVQLVAGDASWRYFVGVAEPSGGVLDHGLLRREKARAVWAASEYNDFGWTAGLGPVGYDTATPADYKVGTDLRWAMYQKATTVYTRSIFTVTSTEALSAEHLFLSLDYDDGVVVYLNGREIARRHLGNAGTLTPHTQAASEDHPANGDNGGTSTGQEERIDLGSAASLLVSGNNVLAVQLANSGSSSSDLLVRTKLELAGNAGRTLLMPEAPLRYLVGTDSPVGLDRGDMSLADPIVDGTEDWIELRNTGDTEVSLKSWSLTDNAAKPRKWNFPSTASIPAKGYLLVLASELTESPATGASYLHAAFKLSPGGEYLGLIDASGKVVDALSPKFAPQTPRYSYGRDATGSWVYFEQATPGAENPVSGVQQEISPPAFSLQGGFHPGVLTLGLSSTQPGDQIRYTLDGSTPGPDTGLVYSAPFALTASTSVRAIAVRAGYAPSAVVTQTYLLAQSAARRALPTVCLAGDPAGVFYGPNSAGGPATGHGILAIKGGRYVAAEYEDVWDANGDPAAYNYPQQRGQANERQTSLEFLQPGGSLLRTEFGLRFAGSDWSRPRMRLTDPVGGRFDPWSGTQKPSFNLYFRSDFGNRPQVYPFIPDNPVTSFEDIRLRAGKNDMVDPFITDELMRRLFIATGQQGSRGTFTTLYINGIYKGYYNLCERLRDEFMRQHHGGKEEWDVRAMGDIESGDSIEWNRLMDFLVSSDLSRNEDYTKVQELVDVDNIIDYLLLNSYAATWDWPLNNWVAARERSSAGRWRLYMWDAEGAFGIYNRRAPATYDSFIGDLDGDGVADYSERDFKLDLGADARTSVWKCIPTLYTLLKASPEFRLRWADRAQKHFYHAGAFTPDNMEALWVQLRDTVQPIIREETNTTISERIRTDWLVSTARRKTFFTQLRKYGLWVATLAPEFSQHGGVFPWDGALGLSNPNTGGTLYYTIDGSDPRKVGGAAAGFAYAAPITLPRSCTVKARVLSASGEWSPLQEASFTLTARPPAAPAFTAAPLDCKAALGGSTQLVVTVTGYPAPALRWQSSADNGATWKDLSEDLTHAGTHSATLNLSQLGAESNGLLFRCIADNGVGSPVISAAARLSTVVASRLSNLSMRAWNSGTAGSVIAGLVVDGPSPARFLVRAVGTRLKDFGVNSPLANPRIQLLRRVGSEDQVLAQNDDWTLSTDPVALQEAARKVGAFDLGESDSHSSAFITELPAGAYTAVVSPGAGSSPDGIVLVEVYDLGNSGRTLTNLSSRGQVGLGEQIMVPGFVVHGEIPQTFLVRAVGPGLAQFGLGNLLENPRLRVVRQDQTEVASNDDWADNPELATSFQKVGAFALPAGSKDAALLVSLPPGSYTVLVSGAGTQTGLALVELYAMP